MLRKLMPIKPRTKTEPPAGKWGSTYDAERGGWVSDKPAKPKR
jgi:hypothetical protein